MRFGIILSMRRVILLVLVLHNKAKAGPERRLISSINSRRNGARFPILTRIDCNLIIPSGFVMFTRNMRGLHAV